MQSRAPTSAPQNASAWLASIAQTLATADPENAATYESNATAAQQKLAALTETLDAELSDLLRVPTIDAIKAAPFFAGVDFANLRSLEPPFVPQLDKVTTPLYWRWYSRVFGPVVTGADGRFRVRLSSLAERAALMSWMVLGSRGFSGNVTFERRDPKPIKIVLR